MRKISSEAHRHLLQYIISKGCGEEEELGEKVRQFKERYDNIERRNYRNLTNPTFEPILTDQTLSQYIDSINMQIRPFYMEIGKIMYKLDRKNYYGIRNVDEKDDIGIMTTNYEPDQLKYFETILKKIRECDIEGFTLSEMDVLNLRLEKKTLAFAERTFKQLINDNWLQLRRNGTDVWFGVRTCISLPNFLEMDIEKEDEERDEDEDDDDDEDTSFNPNQKDDDEEVEGEGEI